MVERVICPEKNVPRGVCLCVCVCVCACLCVYIYILNVSCGIMSLHFDWSVLTPMSHVAQESRTALTNDVLLAIAGEPWTP